MSDAQHVPTIGDEQFNLSPDPEGLKNLGNAAFAAGNIEEAIHLWKDALKAALKKSVRFPSPKLNELQMDIRMNLSWGFYKEGDYVMAKDHILVVMDGSQNKTPKMFYRMAQIFSALHDLEKALIIVNNALSGPFPDNAALLQLKHQVEFDLKRAAISSVNKLKKNIDLTHIDDPRAFEVAATRPNFRFDPNWSPETLAKQLIQWRNTAELMEGEVFSDIDDWQHSRMWITPFTHARLSTDKTVVYMSLPLTICLALENALRDPLPPNQRRALNATDMSKSYSLIRLPASAVQPDQPASAVQPDQTSNQTRPPCSNTPISRHFRSALSEAVLTIHVVGARGDREMECKWSAILDRMPYVEILQVILIGFLDEDDPYNSRLKSGVLCPPLTKKSAHRQYQTFVARIFKGTYQDFLHNAEFDSNQPKRGIDLNGFEISPVLSNPDHEFFPGVIVMPEPDFKRYLESWTPALAEIILARIVRKSRFVIYDWQPLIITGYSVLEGSTLSHDALIFPPIFASFNAKIAVPMYLNPFSLAIDPGPDCVPMTLADGSEFSGISAKHSGKSTEKINSRSVVSIIHGIDPNGSMTPDETREVLTKVAGDPKYRDTWLEPLLSRYGMSEVDKSLLKFVVESRETIIQYKTNDLTQQLDRMLKKSKTGEQDFGS